MPRVLNRRSDVIPDDAIYVGRPTKWGNPYVVGRHGTRDQVIALYESYLEKSGLIDAVHELRGRDLACWCAPDRCHADILVRLANE